MFQYSSFMASWLHFTSSRVLETCISLHFPWSYKITELGASKKCKCNLSLQERLTWNVKLKDIKRQYCVVRGGKYLYSGDRAAVKVSRYPHVISLISYPCRLDTGGATGRCLRSSPRSGRKIDRFTARLQILNTEVCEVSVSSIHWQRNMSTRDRATVGDASASFRSLVLTLNHTNISESWMCVWRSFKF